MNVEVKSTWVDTDLIVKGAPGGVITVNVRCRCGRACKMHQDDRYGFYCRKHGLQGFITHVNGERVEK